MKSKWYHFKSLPPLSPWQTEFSALKGSPRQKARDGSSSRNTGHSVMSRHSSFIACRNREEGIDSSSISWLLYRSVPQPLATNCIPEWHVASSLGSWIKLTVSLKVTSFWRKMIAKSFIILFIWFLISVKIRKFTSYSLIHQNYLVRLAKLL